MEDVDSDEATEAVERIIGPEFGGSMERGLTIDI